MGAQDDYNNAFEDGVKWQRKRHKPLTYNAIFFICNALLFIGNVILILFITRGII